MDKTKSKILKEIMDLMDQEDGARLMKHPKLVAAKITVGKGPMGEMPMGDMMKEEEEVPKLGEEGMGEGMNEEMGEEMESPEIKLGDILEDIGKLPPEQKAKLMKLLK